MTDFVIEEYEGERQIGEVISLMEEDLSEPYNVFTYRYFLQLWPKLAFFAYLKGSDGKKEEKPIGAIVCKMEPHKSGTMRGYIAMLAVKKEHRKRGIGESLVRRAIAAMSGADEIALETEITNTTALSFYGRLGFIREKRLLRYYMNGGDAFQLILPVKPPSNPVPPGEEAEDP